MRIESPSMFYPIFVSKDSVRIPEMQYDSTTEEWIAKEKPKKMSKFYIPLMITGRKGVGVTAWKEPEQNSINLKQKIQKGKLHAYVKGRINDEGILPMTWWDKKNTHQRHMELIYLKTYLQSFKFFLIRNQFSLLWIV